MTINNDLFANRIPVTPQSTDAVTTVITALGTGNNLGYGGEVGEPNHAGVSAPLGSAWWTWTAPVTGIVTINTNGSGNINNSNVNDNFRFDTTLGVYTGTSITGLLPIASNDDTLGFFSQVQFNAVAGTSYQIAVDTYLGRDGQPITLNLSQAVAFTQTGNASSNFLTGSGANDVIRGLEGNDTIYGNGGNDALFGGAGMDLLAGTSGNDYIDGGTGNDTIYGNDGINTLIGGAGDDLIYGGNGRDAIFGGDGNDTIYSNGGGDYIDSGSGHDTVWLGGAANVVLRGGEGFDVVNNFQVGQNKFLLDHITFGQLSFANTNGSVSVTGPGNDLLAIVVGQQASVIGQAANFG